MLPDMHVVGIDFDTNEFVVDDWMPSDPDNCRIWATVNVGNDRGASLFRVLICTSLSISRISNEDKPRCFVIDQYQGRLDLIDRFNEFIEAKVGRVTGDRHFALSKYWQWEYHNLK